MSEFFKKFLAEDPRRFQEGATRGVFLGAFGKHPGWDDHVEDLGLETESLIQAKTLLYVQGIGSQIDSGEWEKLDSAQQLPAFKHVFLWQRGRQFLMGRMWSSSDGKGRKRYPMIVCVHAIGVSSSWMLEEVMPRLETLERECVQVQTAQEIRQLLERHRKELRQRLAETAEGPPSSVVATDTLARFVNHPSLGPDQEGWHRLLYQMESQLHAYAPGQFSIKKEGVRPQQIRLPQCGAGLAETFRLWLRFFNEQVDPAVPVLLVTPVDADWIDVTLGEPTAQECFSLRATTKKVPLVTEVPYNLDAAFRQRARSFMAGFQRGVPQPDAEALPDPETTTFFTKPGAGRPKWLKWLGGGVGLLILLGIAAVLLKPAGSEDAASSPRNVAESPSAASGTSAPDTGRDPAATMASTALQTAADSTGTNTVPPALPPESEEARATRMNAELEQQRQKLAQDTEARRTAEAEAQAVAQAEEKARLETEAARRKAEEEALARRMAEEKEALRQAEVQREAEAKARREAEERAAEAARLQAEEEQRMAALAAQKEAEAKAQTGAGAATPATAGQTQAQSDQPRFMTNGIGLQLVLLPTNEWAGKYEVTQGQFLQVMGDNPSHFTGDPQRPVESVSWHDAVEFCRKLTSLEKDAGSLPEGARYSLPTRAQWTGLLGGAALDEAVMSRDKRRLETAPVGTAPANRWGLHDVLGNVWEWCADDGNAGQKIAMGGSYTTARTFYFRPFEPTSSRGETPETRAEDVGFRCVLVMGP